jgi:hypothetical protein
MATGRYDEPPDKLRPDSDVNLALIDHYLWEAANAPKAERAAAKRAIIDLYRIQRAQVKDGRLAEMDARIFAFVQEGIRLCANQTDPLGAVEDFLNPDTPLRGRPKTPHRDFVIAGDVAESVEAGATVDEVCGQLENATGLKFDQIRRIYFAQKRADERSLRIDLVRRKAERESLCRVRTNIIALLKAWIAGQGVA